MLVGCAGLGGDYVSRSALPQLDQLECCWQAQEQLKIVLPDNQLQLSSVVARTQEALTVVILDPLGRRWLTVTQQGREMAVEQSPDITEELPVKWLLLGVFLRNMPIGNWMDGETAWNAQQQGLTRILRNGDTPVIYLTPKIPESAEQSASDKAQVGLLYPQLQMKVDVTELSRISL